MRQVKFRDPAGYERIGEWIEDYITAAGQQYQPDDIEILPPTEPSKILCLAGNYSKHAGEVHDRPRLFMKGPNAVAGHQDTVTLPIGKEEMDAEGEVGVIIDKQCRNVTKDEALEVVAGYTCFNDISNREDQREEQNWIRGKAFDNSAPIGPVVVSPDTVPDPEDPRVQVRVNDEKKQDSQEDELIFTVSEVITEITKLITLEPGDVIALGTPGETPSLSDGDIVEIEVDGVGTLINSIKQSSTS